MVLEYYCYCHRCTYYNTCIHVYIRTFLRMYVRTYYTCLYLPLLAGAINVSAPDHFSEGTSPGLVTSVSCSGMETSILECTHNTSSRGSQCDSAGIVCQGIHIYIHVYVHVHTYLGV